MRFWGEVLILLGLLNIGLGALSRRWGSPWWRSRIGTGVVVTLGGVYLYLTAVS